MRFRGLKKSHGDNPESEYDGRVHHERRRQNATFEAPVPTSSCSPAPPGSSPARSSTARSTISSIDEAGQVSLADALAMGTAARNLILLGDPLQLAQVSQGVHPAGSGASVLEHLLGDAPTIPADRGVFLERSCRMHPDVCAFISEIVYAGRLASDECGRSADRRPVGTGIRFVPVEHEGNRVVLRRGGGRIATRSRGMLGRHVHRRGRHDAPAPRGRLHGRRALQRPGAPPARRRCRPACAVGTVDKFQGQEAPIVFFSMATSSGEDVPRDLEFLFSRNRLNVAISRAQCLAVLVCSPRLLEAAVTRSRRCGS